MTWDRIFSSSPVNKSAAMVTGKSRGLMPEGPKLGDHLAHWKERPAIVPLPAGVPDLSGLQVGRLSVVGYYGKSKSGGKAKWLVRCACGDYEVRSARAINNPLNSGDMCHVCRDGEYLKERFNSTGKWRERENG